MSELMKAVDRLQKAYEEKYGEDITAEIMCKTIYCGRALTFGELNAIINEILQSHGISEGDHA